MAGGRAGFRECRDVGTDPPLPQFLTLLRHVQGLHQWLYWECPLMTQALGCAFAAGLLSLPWGHCHRPLLALGSLLLWGPLGAGAGAGTGWEGALYQLLYSEEVGAFGIHMST